MFKGDRSLHFAEYRSPRRFRLNSAAEEVFLQNRLVCALFPEERARLLPGMQLVSLTLNEVLYEPGTYLDYVYLPTTSIVSSTYTTQEGATVQMALIGNEGIAGIELFLDRNTAHTRVVVQIGGGAIKVAAKPLIVEFARGEVFQRAVLRYSDRLLTQLAQTAVCNRLHSVEQRLCRWLLECDDRVNGNEIQMTQENIANMLGVRREAVTMAAGRLKEADLIHYGRGHIHIVDRKGLESLSCECYRAVEQEMKSALISIPRARMVR